MLLEVLDCYLTPYRLFWWHAPWCLGGARYNYFLTGKYSSPFR